VGVGGFKGLKGANSFVNKFWEKNLPISQAPYEKNSGKKIWLFAGVSLPKSGFVNKFWEKILPNPQEAFFRKILKKKFHQFHKPLTKKILEKNFHQFL
jgi:hypothetical protein